MFDNREGQRVPNVTFRTRRECDVKRVVRRGGAQYGVDFGHAGLDLFERHRVDDRPAGIGLDRLGEGLDLKRVQAHGAGKVRRLVVDHIDKGSRCFDNVRVHAYVDDVEA